MRDQKAQARGTATRNGQAPVRFAAPRRALNLAKRAWRPVVSALAVVLAGVILVHAVNGKDGFSSWQQKRSEDKRLGREIEDLQQENAQLKGRIELLKSSPEAIGHAAREKLRYVGPNEVIVTISPKEQAQPAAK